MVSKYEFLLEFIALLGHMVSQDCIMVYLVMMESINIRLGQLLLLIWKLRRSRRILQIVYGGVLYYSCTFDQLTHLDVPFYLSKECELSFQISNNLL